MHSILISRMAGCCSVANDLQRFKCDLCVYMCVWGWGGGGGGGGDVCVLCEYFWVVLMRTVPWEIWVTFPEENQLQQTESLYTALIHL